MTALALLLLMVSLIIALAGYWDPLGAVLYRVEPGMLNSLQAGVQRYVAPWLWDIVFVPILELPAFVLPAAVGIVMLAVVNLRREPA